MKIWAFATSPAGLALTETAFWAMTPRELAVLRDVWLDSIERAEYAQAAIQATLLNCNAFRYDGEDVPWTAEDLLGRGDRAARKRKRTEDRMKTFNLMKELDRAERSQSLEDVVPDFILELERNRKVMVH